MRPQVRSYSEVEVLCTPGEAKFWPSGSRFPGNCGYGGSCAQCAVPGEWGRLLAGILLDMIGNEAKCRHLVRVPSGQGIRIRMNCRRHASYGFVLTSI